MEQQYQNPTEETTGLAAELEEFNQHEAATSWQRLLNLVIDHLVMRFGISWASSYILIYSLQALGANELIYALAEEDYGFETVIMLYLFSVINYLIYYTICEKAFRGYTLGKLITGTRAIRLDGQELTLKDALLRSLSRMVPFEAFSGLGQQCNPWHDSWTKTAVVKVNR